MSEHGFEKIRSFKKGHLVNRLFERFAIEITEEKYQEIIFEISEYINEPIYVNPDDGKSFHIVKLGTDTCVFLYDWEYDSLLTVYHLKWFEKTPDGFWRPRPRRMKRNIRSFDRYRTTMKKLGVTVE
jgi:hypothetical protein